MISVGSADINILRLDSYSLAVVPDDDERHQKLEFGEV